MKHTIQIEVNGDEYTVCIFVVARDLKKTGNKSISADGVSIEFEENIVSIEPPPKKIIDRIIWLSESSGHSIGL